LRVLTDRPDKRSASDLVPFGQAPEPAWACSR